MNRRSSLQSHLAVLALYLAITLYLLARVLPHFGHAIPGGGLANADGWQNVWNIWWTQYALIHGKNVFSTDMVFHPDGAELYLQHALHISNNLLTLPVQALAGPVAAYNTAVLLGFVLTGYGTYLLVQHLVKHRGIATFAGALCTFSPFHLARLWDGHLSWVTLQWIPLYMWALLLAFDTAEDPAQRPARRRMVAMGAGGLLVLVSLNNWYHAIYSLIFTVLLVAVRLPTTVRARRWRSEVVTLALVGGTSALLLLPVLLPTLRIYAQGEHGTGGWDRLIIAHSADVLDWLFPSYMHPLWGALAEQWHNAMRPGIWGWVITPGVGVVVLALVGALGAWRQVRPWLIIIGVLVLLSLGPRLSLAGIDTHLPTPYVLLKGIPGIAMARRPNHLVVIVLPLLAVVAGYGMRWLLRRGCAGELALIVLGGGVIVEYAVLPLPALPFFVHPIFYHELREQPGAVLELPIEPRSAVPMVHQMVHQRPIVTGYLSRTPDIPPFVQQVPWVRALWQMQPPPAPDIIAQPPDVAQQAFSFYDIRTLVVWHTRMQPQQRQALEQVIAHMLPGIAPAHQRPEMTVYAIPPVESPRPFLYLGEGWYGREHVGEHAWRWMATDAGVHLVNPVPEPRQVTLTLSAESYQEQRPLLLTLDGSMLGQFEVPRSEHTLHLRLLLPPGEHTLHLHTTPGGQDPATGRVLSLSFTHIALE
jgi:hypothetical protein